MISIPKNIKLCIPGYHYLWKRRSQCFLDHLAIHAPLLSFGEDDGVPYLEHGETGSRLYGFVSDAKSEDLFSLIHPYVSVAIPDTHYRLIKDFINRYLYPHMRPELNIVGYGPDQMAGFHGQHKDSIQNLPPEYHDQLTRAFTPSPDDIIINCGAFIGFGDIRMSEDLNSGRIIAIEASKPCFDLLQRNLSANHVPHVTPIHRAIWNEVTTMELESDFAQANSLVEEVHKGSHTQEVQTITIDQVMKDFSLPKLDMVSLTVNGAEVEALDGAKETLGRHRPRIRLAGWYSRGGEKIAVHAKRILEEFDYQVFVGPRQNVLALPR
jgi:FkbM family methyltransferase